MKLRLAASILVGALLGLGFAVVAQVTTNPSVTGVPAPQSAVAITGGTIDGAVIGGTTPAAITGTTITATTKFTFPLGTSLFEDAANTLAQRNGTNAQTFYVYETFTDASNYRRFRIIASSGTTTLNAESAGTGGSSQALALQATNLIQFNSGGSTGRWQINSSGHLVVVADNSYDIGGSITTRIRDLYLNGGAGGNATTGAVGEYLAVNSPAGTTTLSTGTSATVTNQTLTAGDWDCTGVINFTSGATTSYTNLAGGTSTTAATLGTQDTTFDWETAANIPTAAKVMSWVVPMNRFSISASTTVYLVAQATFTSTAPTVGGTLRCRRVR